MRKFKIVLLISSLFLFSCYCNQNKKIKIEGIDDIVFEVSTSYDSDSHSSGYYYELIDKAHNRVFIKKKWMWASGPNEISLSEFEGKSIDSFMYLIWGDKIMTAYDLKSKKELTYTQITDSLMPIIRKE